MDEHVGPLHGLGHASTVTRRVEDHSVGDRQFRCQRTPAAIKRRVAGLANEPKDHVGPASPDDGHGSKEDVDALDFLPVADEQELARLALERWIEWERLDVHGVCHHPDTPRDLGECVPQLRGQNVAHREYPRGADGCREVCGLDLLNAQLAFEEGRMLGDDQGQVEEVRERRRRRPVRIARVRVDDGGAETISRRTAHGFECARDPADRGPPMDEGVEDGVSRHSAVGDRETSHRYDWG